MCYVTVCDMHSYKSVVVCLNAWLSAGAQLEMERALLEGEQQIQLEQLEAAKEKVASLETKESRLLSEAAGERAKVIAILSVLF